MKNQSKGQKTLQCPNNSNRVFISTTNEVLFRKGTKKKKKKKLHLAAGLGWFVYVEGQHHTHTEMEPPREGESTKPNQTIQIKTQSNSHVPHPVSSYNF